MNVEDYLERLKSSQSKVTLRLCAESDAEFILAARGNESRNKHLSETSDDIEAQVSWLRSYKEREAAGEEYYFVLCAGGEDVGLIRLYGFLEDKFCWGSWLILPGAPSTVAYTSAMLMYEIGFGVLNFSSSYFDVRVDNKSVWMFHERCGAELVRTDEIDRHYEFTRDAYLTLREKWTKFLAFEVCIP